MAALFLFNLGGNMRICTVEFNEKPILGSVKISYSPGRDRLKILKEINLSTNKAGDVVFNSEMIDTVLKSADLIQKNLVEIDLVINDEEIKTFEDLEYSSGFNAVIMKLINVMINGPERLGK